MFGTPAHGQIGTSGKGFKAVGTLLLSEPTRFQDCLDALSSVFMCTTPLDLYNCIVFTSSFFCSSCMRQAAKKCLVNLIRLLGQKKGAFQKFCYTDPTITTENITISQHLQLPFKPPQESNTYGFSDDIC